MISVPKGALRLAALRLLSDSSMSGTDFARELERVSSGEWRPGPGSVYLLFADLLKRGLITELPKREGNVRRYIISGKGKEELARLSKEVDLSITRQLNLLAVYSGLAGREDLRRKITSAAKDLRPPEAAKRP